MNVSTFERAHLAAFAYQLAAKTGSLPCVKGICYAMRNRVKAGWGDGSWMTVIAMHDQVSGNLPTVGALAQLDISERLLQLIIRDVDDIYLGGDQGDTEKVVQDALYFQFIDQPARQWFTENIVRDAANHPRVAQIGTIAFFK